MSSSKPSSNARAPKPPAKVGSPPAAPENGLTRTGPIATVSHTLDLEIAERLRHFAFRERISESAIIEFALRVFFESGDEASLAVRLREAGAALRRRNRVPRSRSE